MTDHVEPMTLAESEQIVRAWLGDGYDLFAWRAVLALVAIERLDGDTPWLLIVSGPGNAKTETVSAAVGAGAVVTSTVASEGALLSATSTKERTKDATGGLLRALGPRGVLVIKDVTSILSMSGDRRMTVLAALREVADGFWSRAVGVDGGKSITWAGRIVVIGAVTTAWDSHHSTVAAMGDRFLLLRMDSAPKAIRDDAAERSMSNVGEEVGMRADLRNAFAAVIAGMSHDANTKPTPDEKLHLGSLADFVTRGRTGCMTDFKGYPIDAHALEMPTRLAKQLVQVFRGAIAIGMTRAEALGLATRIAADCLPPLRFAAVVAVAAHPGSTTGELAKIMQKPATSTDRTLQELHLLGVLHVRSDAGDTRWRYELSPNVDRSALDHLQRALHRK